MNRARAASAAPSSTKRTRSAASIGVLVVLLALGSGQQRALAQQGTFLGRAEITLYGIGLKADPAVQTVPKGFATIVSTFLQGASQPDALPPFAPDAEVRATLSGPSFQTPIELVTKPNSPFNIPILTVAGTHMLENIRLVSGGDVLLYATPEATRIEVIDKLLVTTVTARPLTADEIREKGIVFDKANFQAYNFTAAFAIDDGSSINIAFPVVLPTIVGPAGADGSLAALASIDAPQLRSLQTLVPDTLRIQARIPNLSVVGFSLTLDRATASQDFFVPPIPGVIVIPGDIGFLNQFFSVMLMVANVAPNGSNLVVSDLTASIVLPPGKDSVVGSVDDPLAMARRANGQAPRVVAVTQAGADAALGTADDVTSLGPGETGSAEFLVEGKREGTHVVEMELSGTLNGLPIGPVAVHGRAAGAVLVRNPTFTMTFVHPEVVNAGEAYTLDVGVTNTSASPANFVSVNLFAANITGARLDDESIKNIEAIAPGDTGNVSFRLVSNRTGKVTAATLDSDDQVSGRFLLKSAVGELGVPLSPDSLILPSEAHGLPQPLLDATVGLLSRAWAVATAPPAALPKDLSRFSKQLVIDRGVQTAEAGFRVTLGEPLPHAVADLFVDYMGSEYPDLASRVPAGDTTGLLALLQRDVTGFDLLRRRSIRGDAFADAVGRILAGSLSSGGAAFHRSFAEQLTSRAGHVSFLLSNPAGLPVDGVLVADGGAKTGGADASGKIAKEIPFSDVVSIKNDAGAVIAQLFVVAVPTAASYTLHLARHGDADPGQTYDLSAVSPAASGGLQLASWTALAASDAPTVQQAAADVPRILIANDSTTGSPSARPASVSAVTDPAPTLLGAVQIANADMVGCPDSQVAAGRVVAVLFSEQVTPESVQDKAEAGLITAFTPDANRVMSVALQPGGRIAFVALAKPVGPFVVRQMHVQGLTDRSGHAMAGQTSVPIVATVPADGGVVSGRILKADGTPAGAADVRMFYEFNCGDSAAVIGIGQQAAAADGSYSFDYVVNSPRATIKLVAIDPATEELRTVRFRLARSGQRLNVDVVLLGRGTYSGRTLAEDGKTPLANTSIRVTSQTDQSEYGVTTDAAGAFELARVPVGNLLVEAVNVARPAQLFVSDNIPFAGAAVTRDLVLLDVNTTGPALQHGSIGGRVLRADGVTGIAGLPVIAYYRSRSQAAVKCSPPPGGSDEPGECAVAVVTADANGRFAFPALTAGEYRLSTFDQAALQEGVVRVTLGADQALDVSILVAGGFGTVNGVVLDASGHPVLDAVVGGGLSLVNVNPANGTFTMTDVPVGRRQIVAVSNSLQSTGETTIDIVQQGETVSATVVLQPVGVVAGVVRNRDGIVQPGIKVWAFNDCFDELGQKAVCIAGETTTDVSGGYRINKLGIGAYTVSAFRSDLKDGNLVPFAIRYNNQVVVTDITFRGGFGKVAGRVLRAESCPTPPCTETPLPAKVSISGDRLVVAGGQVGVRFEYVQNFAVKDNNFTTGAFEFDGVWVGAFTVRAAGQFSPEPVAVAGSVPAPGVTVTADIRLQPTSRLTGTVLESDGFTPVTNRQISLKFHSNSVVVFCTDDAETGFSECQTIPQGIQEAFAATDASGRFSFPLVNAGPFTLTATDVATGKIATIKGSVRAGETVDLGLRLLGRSRVTVRTFRSDGVTPVANATVSLQQIDYPQEQRTGLATNGTIVFEGGDALSEGQFVVTSIGPNGFAGRASGAVTADNQNVTVDVFLFDATGTVTGQIVREDAAHALVPVPNAEVLLFNASGPMAFAVSDSAGAFSIPLVPTGPFTAESFDPVTAGRGRVTGVVLGGSGAAAVTIRLEALASLRGTVVQSGSLAPLKGWTVALNQTTPSGRSLPPQVTQTGVDGSFSFPGAAVGSYQLYASKSDVVGTAAANGQIARAGQLVEAPMVVNIVRRVTGRVTGLVVTGTGTPAPNAQVEVCGAGDACRPTTGGSDGRFALDEVPLGRFTVRATAQVTGNPSVGRSGGTLLFEGDIADVSVALLGLSTIEGTVFETINNSQVPAANATVQLFGQPGSGCPGACQQSTNASGQFRFINVPAQTFTVVASNLSGQRGSIGDVLTPGQLKTGLQIVLAPAVTLHGRVLLENGTPAGGIVAELSVANGRLFAETAADGAFAFDAVSVGPYSLSLQDPIGGGLAKRKNTITTAAAVELGDITLDSTPPAVADSEPSSGALNVPLATEVRITFSEPLDAGSVNDTTVTVMGPAGPIAGRVDLITNDTVARFRLLPGESLSSQTRYTVRVAGVQDRVGRRMPADYVGSFTTVDIVPPTVVETVPGAAATGVSADSVVRIKFSEIIDPARFAAVPVKLTGPSGEVAGRVDYLFNNTIVVFTPARPLADDTSYTVDVSRATDLAGLAQATATHYTFSTTDRTPPTITSMTATGNGRIIQNAVAKVTAATNTTDIAVVDFFLNDVFAFAARIPPYALSFQAVPALGAPGAQIKISAVATDTSGNRGSLPATLLLTVDADQPPAVAIESPSAGVTAAAGERVSVRVHAADDLGVAEISYAAKGLVVVDAVTRAVNPAAADRREDFGFNIPLDAQPGTEFTIQASARDTQGQATQAAAIKVRVRDTVGPVVQLTGVSSGQRVLPGTTVRAIVSTSDPSGVATIGFAVSGVTTFADQRQVVPAQSPVATSFEFTVPATATSTDKVFLDAFAIDGAGNRSNAARLILPVADKQAPTVSLHTTSGGLTIVPGSTVSIQVDATDDLALANVQLTGSGGLTFAETRSLAEPVSFTSSTFVVNVPSSLASGATATFTALAVDASGNSSVPVTLVLTARATAGLTMPPSLLLLAGDTSTLQVTLDGPAPAGGVKIDLVVSDATRASATPSLVFASGESQKSATVTAIAGGSTQIDARVGGITRATTTVTVVGGIVHGTIVVAGPSGFTPVPGAQVTVFHAGAPLTAVSDVDGSFTVQGVEGRDFSVGASDGTLLGFVDDSLNVPGGSASTTVILLPVGALAGTVTQADAVTPAGAGVKVDLFESATPSVTVATTFTDAAGHWRLPLVAPGSYFLDASDDNGNHGRSSATVGGTGVEIDVPIAFLGRGTVVVKVTSGAGSPVSGATVEFNSSSLFGGAPTRSGTTNAQGQVTFANVLVGSVAASARDPLTNQAGSRSGQLASNGESINLDLQLSSFGNLQGTVLRADGLTQVPNATVIVDCAGGGCHFQTTTDVGGSYNFNFLPFTAFNIRVVEPATRGIGFSSGSFSTSGETLTRDVSLLPQGALLVTVNDADGTPIDGAAVSALVTVGQIQDQLSGVTGIVSGTGGRVLLDRLLAGTAVVTATFNGLTGQAGAAVSADQVAAVQVQLEARGSITAQVFDQDGQTPAAGFVRFTRDANNAAVDVPLANGVATATNLRLGAYHLDAYDAQTRLRASKAGVSLASNGQTAQATLTFVGLGTVTGRVLHPTGGDAGNLHVSVQSLSTTFGGFFGATTDAAGNYSVGGVPVGPVKVVSSKPAEQLIGEASGAITQFGQTLTLDVALETNAVNLPISLQDVNDQSYSVGANGGLQGGTGQVFGYGATNLELVSNGVSMPFTGTGFGTQEDSGREIAVRQTDIHGLNVTRKTFVPANGYFARQLEILSNPTTAPITVDLRVSSKLYARYNRFGFINQHYLSSTSSGDNTLNVSDPATADRWAVLNPGGTDSYFNFDTGTPVSFVFAGPDAPVQANVATYSWTNPFASLVYGWGNITVPPGGTVALMHVAAEQAIGYTTAAERLSTVPPELLTGMSVDELTAVRNFVLPSNGLSAVPPLPEINGSIAGRVLEGDGQTGVPGATVKFWSHNKLYSRVWYYGVDGSGNYSITGAPTRPIPLDEYELSAQHPSSSFNFSPLATYTWAPGETAVERQIVFSNSGIMKGIVKRQNGAPVPNAFVTLSFSTSQATDANGRYLFTGVPAGLRNLQGNVSHPQGSSLQIVPQNLTLDPGQVRDDVLLVEPTGTVIGTLRDADGNLQAGRPVTLHTANSSLYWQTASDSSGRFAFVDVSLGTFIVESPDPVSGFPAKLNVTVAENQVTEITLSYVGKGTLTVNVTRSTGAALAGMNVEVSGAGFNTQTLTANASGAAGPFVSIPLGAPMTVTVYHPQSQFNLRASKTVTLAASAESTAIAMPAFATVSALVHKPNGTLAGANVNVQISGNSIFASGNTDVNSQFNFGPVGVGKVFQLTVYHPTTVINVSRPFLRVDNLVASADGQSIALDTHYPAIAKLAITVQTAPSAPVIGAKVQSYDTLNTNFQDRGNTDSSGFLQVAQVPEGAFGIRVYQPGSATNVLDLTTGAVQAADDGGTVAVTIAPKSFTVVVRGLIAQADGVTPISRYQIRLLRGVDRQVLATTCPGGPNSCGPASSPVAGRFEFPATASTSAGFIVQTYSPAGDGQLFEQAIVPTSNADLDVTLTLPFRTATLTGTIFASDGTTPVGGATVFPVTLQGRSFLGTIVPDTGVYTFTDLFPADGMKIQVSYAGLATVEKPTGPITQTGQVLTTNVTLASSVVVKVRGRVTTGDGVTPFPYGWVELVAGTPGCTTCSSLAAYGSDQNGAFEFRAALPTDGKFFVRAHGRRTNVTGELAGTASGQNGTVDIGAVVVPVNIIKGQVTFGASVPARDVTGFVTMADNSTQFADDYFADGRFAIYEVAPGTVTVTGEDNESGASANVTVQMPSATATIDAHIQLPEVATITVPVLDRNGNQTEEASVALFVPDGSFEQIRQPRETENGRFVFHSIPIGAYELQASYNSCDGNGENCELLFTTGQVSVDATGNLEVTLDFTSLGRAFVRVADGFGQPLAFQDVRARFAAPVATGPLGRYEATTTLSLDDDGTAYFDRLAAGPFSVVVKAQSGEMGIGSGVATTYPDDLSFATVVVGSNVVELGQNNGFGLGGWDGYLYTIDGSGQTIGGARVTDDGQLVEQGGFSTALSLKVAAESLCCAPAGTIDDVNGDKTITLTSFAPRQVPGLTVTRQVFTPAQGGFARYLDTFTNTTARPMTISTQLTTVPNLDTEFWGEVSPSATDGGYVIRTDPNTQAAAFGIVYAGVDPPAAPQLTYPDTYTYFLSNAAMVLAPGQRMALMNFVILRAPDGPWDVYWQIDGLTRLTDPSALSGLSDADKAAIVNFRIPQP